MTIVLRSTKGSNLTPNEVDGNFTDLNGRVTDLEDNPASAIGISNIAVSGSQVIFYLEDGTTFGPFNLPIASFAVRGTWLPDTGYFAMDLVNVNGSGLYLVRNDHTSAGTFDEDATDSDGALYELVVPSLNPVPITTVSAASFTPNPDQANRYFRCTNIAGCVVTLQSDFETNDELHFRQASSGPISFQIGDSGGLINSVAGFDDATDTQGAVATVKHLGNGEWDIFGLLAAAT